MEFLAKSWRISTPNVWLFERENMRKQWDAAGFPSFRQPGIIG